jgi:hypothetical protein
MKSDKLYFLNVGVNDIPWERIIHWYGRATNFPKLFEDILSDDKIKQQNAFNEIKKNIEHQDGIMMATPFTLIFLLRLLSFNNTNKDSLLKIVLTVMKASEFQLQFYKEININLPLYSSQDLLSEKYLWPPFESEEQDEINWEEYEITNEQYYSWVLFTFDVIESFSGLLEKMASNNFDNMTVNEILLIINKTDKIFVAKK